MARIGQLQKQHRAIQELHVLSDEFAAAMTWANIHYIASTGIKTPRMNDIWARYVAWSQKYEKVLI